MVKRNRLKAGRKGSIKERMWALEQKVGDLDQKMSYIIQRLPKNGKPCRSHSQSKLSDFVD
jgi:hypothetical protein